MNKDPIQVRINKRKKEISIKNQFFNILFLLLPVILITGIFIGASTLVLTIPAVAIPIIFLCYISLPLFYTCEKRLRNLINKKKKKYTFIDGYKDFYSLRQNGIFGLFMSISLSIMLLLAFYLLFSNMFLLFCSPFPGATETVNNIINSLTDGSVNNIINSLNQLEKELYLLIKPLVLLISVISFIPFAYFIFFSLDNNLANHFLATIILPDADLNFPASQSKSIVKSTVRRPLSLDILKYRFKNNWIYYLSYILLYVGSVFIFISIDYSSNINTYLFPIVITAVPIISLFYGLIINHFVLTNDYIIIDELSSKLHTLLPTQIIVSLQSVYDSKMYIHGEDSKIKGPFFNEKHEIFNVNKILDNEFDAFFNNTLLSKKDSDGVNLVQTDIKENDIKENKVENDSDDIGIQSNVFDFSSAAKHTNDVSKKDNNDNKNTITRKSASHVKKESTTKKRTTSVTKKNKTPKDRTYSKKKESDNKEDK